MTRLIYMMTYADFKRAFDSTRLINYKIGNYKIISASSASVEVSYTFRYKGSKNIHKNKNRYWHVVKVNGVWKVD
ncbi:hypothetical protein ciss_15340 [Carboxydothermus islandicus]|uniref:Uncharacterized protein n=1 Tax=Carboxydothermus islandicus TaxID=661089 RepID=A0A1L8D3F3_9THEO|nr:hypothetical protein ciss_15340 [Carboxydothermus islandicus]